MSLEWVYSVIRHVIYLFTLPNVPFILWRVQLRPHVMLDERELRPGEEWSDASGYWKIVRISKGILLLDGKTRFPELQPGDVLVIHPTDASALRASRINSAAFQYFYFQPEHLLGLMTASERLALSAFAATTETQVLPSAHPIAKQFAEIASGTRHWSFFTRCRLLNLAAVIFEEIRVPAIRQSSPTTSSHLKILEKISDEDLIRLPTTALANLSGCRVKHFQRSLRAQYGTSLRIKQRELRLEKALQLLTDTDMSIREIAHVSRYKDSRFFVAMFKRTFGRKPSEWRDELAEKKL
jgi:AraC-like DNA-binding protein